MMKIKRKNGTILIDNEDAWISDRFCITVLCHKYVTLREKWSTIKRKYEYEILLHRFLMNPKKNQTIDHVNGNPLDNRRSNLRVCTQGENTRNQKIRSNNSSGFKGVSFSKNRQKYEAYIKVDYKKINLGRYVDIGNAIMARKKAEEKYFGEFARK